MNLLQSVRPDFVKLDRALVSEVDRDPYRAKMVHRLLQMALDLDVEIVAEGIERVEEWQWLAESGVHYGQGCPFARPASPQRPVMPVKVEPPGGRQRSRARKRGPAATAKKPARVASGGLFAPSESSA